MYDQLNKFSDQGLCKNHKNHIRRYDSAKFHNISNFYCKSRWSSFHQTIGYESCTGPLHDIHIHQPVLNCNLVK